MTNEEKKMILELRKEGKSYNEIATQLKLKKGTVHMFLKRYTDEQRNPPTKCECCGKPISSLPGKKIKRFCSDKCRMKWWNSHKALVKRKAFVTTTCLACGKEFTLYSIKGRKYCCHACYVSHRYGGSDND